MPDNRKSLIYGAFPVCRNYTVRAHILDAGNSKRHRPENGRGDPRSRLGRILTGRVHPCHGRYEKRSRTENQRLHGKRGMKKAKKTAPAVGNAPIGGEFSLPALSAPNSRLGHVWVRRKSHRILHRKKFGICRKIRLKSKGFNRIWSECRDSNPRPLGPEPSAIPNFATPRQLGYYT